MSKWMITCIKGILFLIPLLLITTFSIHTEAASKSVDRISGANRFDTSVEVSKRGWPSGANTVIISVGDNFPDALSGAPLAYNLNAPILLTNKTYLPGVVKNEITRLHPTKAIILGGENVISTTINDTLKTLGVSVERISGKNRYETTAAIASKLNNQKDTAIIAYGDNFPDSLSIAAFASRNGYPILLTEKNQIPKEIKETLSHYKNTIVIGGEGVISNSVYNQLPSPQRISGSNRYGTAAKIVETLGDPNDESYIATGQAFADALTGSVLAAKDKSPILLVEKNNVPSEVGKVISNHDINNFSVIGGKSVVTDNVTKMLTFDVQALINTAKSLIGVSYSWGGTTPQGFDCSGYIDYVYKKQGIDLPRTTSELWNSGKTVNQPSVGGLVFFETYKSGPSHVGIYIGNNEFIHASSTKGISITSLSNSYFKPKYLGSKRVY